MGRNLQGLRDLAVTEHDDIMLCLLDNAPAVKHVRCDFIIRREVLLKRFEADFDPLLLKDVREAALRQAAVKWHLTAFETDLRRIARARLLPFCTTAGSLAQAAARPTSEALLFMRRTFGWMKIVK